MTSSSLQSLYMTLAPVAVASAIYILLFLVLRPRFKRWYAPRTYLGSLKPSQRTAPLKDGIFNWIKDFFGTPDHTALKHQSLDAYLFLRFLRMTVLVTFVGCLITWPVLFPVNATGGGGQVQLDILSYSNVDSSTFKKRHRYFAHLFVSWIYYGFVMYLIFRETVFYINLRQAILLSPAYAQRLSSRTVLFTSVPESMRDEQRVRKVFGDVVRNVWVLHDTKELAKKVEERDDNAYRLEKAEVKLITTANKLRAKSLQQAGAVEEAKGNNQLAFDEVSGSRAAAWLPDKKRPTHRTGLLGLIGPKVDTINHCRERLTDLIPEIQTAQANYRNTPSIGAIFVEFTSQATAENAFQSIAHHEGLKMNSYIGITPEEVVWPSLSIPWWQLAVRRYAVVGFIAALVIFWAIPVAVVGVISNVSYLEKISFLTWLKKIPTVVMGLVSGLLPSVALSILMSLVPVIMRLCARLAGEPSLPRVELFTQNAYFCFQVVQVFLVTTMSSSASAVAKQIAENPSKVTEILANNLPKASNFYMSYFIVQGLTVAASILSQVVGLAIFFVMYKYITGTPRGLYEKWSSLAGISWGSTLPVYTNIAVIAITYSAIAPLVLGWACLGMALFYLAWRYNVLYVTNSTLDTRGLIYPRALQQLMTGVYLSEICMIGLFGASVAIIQLVLQVIFLVFTILVHMSINTALDPLLHSMPQTLLALEAGRTVDVESSVQGGVAVANGPAAAKQSSADDRTVGSKEGHQGVAANGVLPPIAAPAPDKVNALLRFLKPWKYDNYDSLRRYIPEVYDDVDFNTVYSDNVTASAYLPPAVGSQPPLLWIPEDPAGISKQELAHTSRVIAITDDACTVTDSGKLNWDEQTARPPVWEEKVPF